MSAVFGIYYRDGRPVDGELALMSRTLAHRGAVEHGWQDGHIALGVREGASGIGKLLVTDDLVFAGELRLDDPDGLRETLDAPKEATDVQLVLTAYRRWGESCPVHILGDFAFAIWDRTRKHLFCARDCFGVRPFYYHESPKQFSFASEAKALLILPGITKAINEERIGDWLIDLRHDKVATLFRGVSRLPPASVTSVTTLAVDSKPYWDIHRVAVQPHVTEPEYVEEYLRLLRESVSVRLGRNVGAFLSGGLDSSTIVCLATRLMNVSADHPLPTFSAIYPYAPQCDERRFIEMVRAEQPIETHYFSPERPPLIDDAEISPEFDEPIWLPTKNVLKCGLPFALRTGVSVALMGIGGDEVTSHGIGRLHELFRSGQWPALWREVRGPDRSFPISKSLRLAYSHGPRRALSNSTPEVVRKLARRPVRTWDTRVPIKPEFVRRVGLVERWNAFTPRRHSVPATDREDDARLIGSGEAVLIVEAIDRLSGPFDIDIRMPYYDRRLVEFCLSVPSSLKLRTGWTRWIGRTALSDILPRGIAWRRDKSVLDDAIVHQLATVDRDRIFAPLVGSGSRMGAWLDLKELGVLYERFCEAPNWPDGSVLWRTATIARFLERTA